MIRKLLPCQIADPARGMFMVEPRWNKGKKCFVAPSTDEGAPTRPDSICFVQEDEH